MIQKLFEIPLWYDHVDPNSYNKEQIITTIKNNYKKNPSRSTWDSGCNMHHSYNDNDNTEYEQLNYRMLKVVYQNKINQFAKEVLSNIDGYKCKLEIVNYTAMGTGGHMTRHNHFAKDSEFVGVHYLKFDQNQHSTIRFWNPHSLFVMLSGAHPVLDNLGICQADFIPQVQEDMILIYPSFLEHDIFQQKETDSLRMSIAFNFTFYRDTQDVQR